MNKPFPGESREEIRARMRRLRAQLEAPAQEKATDRVSRHILSLDAYKNARTVMAYAAARGELSLAPVMEDALASGKRLVLPRCEAPGVMTARWVRSMDELEEGAYGLLEPRCTCEIIPCGEIDLILAPGTAFDREGNRIGQGGGYYDRFLPGTRAARVGICHGFALFEHLHAQEHDAKMDAVVTPEGVYAINQEDDGG